MSDGEVRWDSSQLCGSEQLWSCCYPQSSGMPVVLLGDSLALSQGWIPNPSAPSALEGSGLSVDDELADGNDFREFCATVYAPQC